MNREIWFCNWMNTVVARLRATRKPIEADFLWILILPVILRIDVYKRQAHADDTFYVLGSAVGPHPYPTIVRGFKSVISKEIKQQLKEKEGRLPDCVEMCIRDRISTNAVGLRRAGRTQLL